jgi:hypothetical protein
MGEKYCFIYYVILYFKGGTKRYLNSEQRLFSDAKYEKILEKAAAEQIVITNATIKEHENDEGYESVAVVVYDFKEIL